MRFSLQELWKLLKGIYAETQNLTGFLRRWAKNLGIASAKESPLRFLMWVATALAGVGAVASLFGMTQTSALEALSQFFWIALTLVFTAFAEAILQSMSETQTKRLRAAHEKLKATLLAEASASAPARIIDAQELKEGDCVLVRAGETIPADGEVLSGIASVDESALTGESAPVIREAGADRNAVTAGTRVLSDYLVIKVLKTSKEGAIERMLRLVKLEKRKPSEIESALSVFITLSTIVAGATVAAVWAVARAWSEAHAAQSPIGPMEAIALFLCLSPTTLGVLLPIVGAAGMLRLLGANVMAKSAHALEAAGNITTLIIDKTGTLTFGDRRAREFYPVSKAKEQEFLHAALMASLQDPTTEGRSILARIKATYSLRPPERLPSGLTYVPFSAQTQLSGINWDKERYRKGSLKAIEGFLGNKAAPKMILESYQRVAGDGGTPLIVANGEEYLGVIALKDTLKGGLKERFAALRGLGVKTIMATGDNPLTAATIAAEAGVDDFVAEATPEKKLQLIREYQAQGQSVGMSGDGSNDAPAMAQADVALAMNSATAPTKEACNLIDLDNTPTKLLNIVRIGKENIITIGALTTFSFSSDAVKTLMLFGGMLPGVNPALKTLDMVGFDSPAQALTLSLALNAVVILLALPLALKGVVFRARPPHRLLARHFVLYGLGGAALPFIIMKALEVIL